MITMLALVWIHFVADFILQSDYVAQNKSKSNYVLGTHMCYYTLPFFIFGVEFAIINGLAHGLVDYFTSRFNSRMWAEKRVHAFFVGVGFDQAVHVTTLLITAHYML